MPIEHLSYSAISTYLTCPRSFQFRYIDGIQPDKVSSALTFGTAFHRSVEAYIGGQQDYESIVDLTQHWDMQWREAVQKDGGIAEIAWGDDTPDGLFALGVKMLEDQETQAFLDNIKPLVLSQKSSYGSGAQIERFIKYTIPGVDVPIVGYIDIITSDGIPGDFKTASRRWSDYKAQASLQPLFYLYPDYPGKDINPQNRFRFYVFIKSCTPQVQSIEVQFSDKEVSFIEELTRSVWEGIVAESFPLNPTTWKCSPKWCDYWSICRGRYYG